MARMPFIKTTASGRLFTPIVTLILILSIAGLLACHFGKEYATAILALDPQHILPWHPWQFITYPFISQGLMQFMFNGIVLLFIGSPIEREWKSGSFLILWLVLSVASGFGWVVANWLFGMNFSGQGSIGCLYGLLAVSAIIFRGRPLCLMGTTIASQHLYIGMIILTALLNLNPPINLVWLLGALTGWGFVRLIWRHQQATTQIDPEAQRRHSGFIDLD